MDFRLVYRGPLASDGDARQKHAIRKQFHPQLAELWKTHPLLRKQTTEDIRLYTTPSNMVSEPGPNVPQIMRAGTHHKGKPWVQHLGDKFKRGNYRFAPLVLTGQVVCSLEILFLRRENPGNIVRTKKGGDIDNRLKTLLDALQMAESGQLERSRFPNPEAHEDPFFCLLQNDSDIAELKVTTDRLLVPPTEGGHIDDVELVIYVKTKAINTDALFIEAHIL